MLLSGERRSSPSYLQVGVVIDSSVLPAWKARVIDDLKTTEFIHLTEIVVNDNQPNDDHAPWFFRIYEKLDIILFRPTANPLGQVEVSESLKGIEHLPISALPTHGSSPTTRFRWDVVVWLSCQQVSAHIAGHSRHGVLSFCLGNSAHTQKSAEYFG